VTTTAVCVGGPIHSQIISGAYDTICVSVPTTMKYTMANDDPQVVNFRTEQYRREQMILAGVKLDLWMHESLIDEGEMLKQALLAMLRPEVLDLVVE
jgi:hypothetical protein